MKILKIFPKKFILKRLEKRNILRINEYTSVSDSLKPDIAQQLNKNIDSIARYAQRKDCFLEFVPPQDTFQNSVKMNVYKRGMSFVDGRDGLPMTCFSTKNLSGDTTLACKNNDSDLIGDIRKNVKNIIASDKNWYNKITSFICM